MKRAIRILIKLPFAPFGLLVLAMFCVCSLVSTFWYWLHDDRISVMQERRFREMSALQLWEGFTR